MAVSDAEVGSAAAGAIRELLSPDALGRPALEALQLVADLVRRRKCAAPARVVEALLVLRLREVAPPSADDKGAPQALRVSAGVDKGASAAVAAAGCRPLLGAPRKGSAQGLRLVSSAPSVSPPHAQPSRPSAKRRGARPRRGSWRRISTKQRRGPTARSRRRCRARYWRCGKGGVGWRPEGKARVLWQRVAGWGLFVVSELLGFESPGTLPATSNPQALFETFFRVLKHCAGAVATAQAQQRQQAAAATAGAAPGGSAAPADDAPPPPSGAALEQPWPASRVAGKFPLLAPVLAGLGRYSHLISVEYFNDLMAVLLDVRLTGV
jgi:hypothetical protein